MGLFLLNMGETWSLKPAYKADSESSPSPLPCVAQWISQEGSVCKCVRKRGQGERTPISQLIESRY